MQLMTRNQVLTEDLDHILEQTQDLWQELRNQRIFITGGTGFFGCWLLESFIWANEKLGLNASVVVLTRNVELFGRKAPHLANHPSVEFHIGDIRSFSFPSGEFYSIIHAATEASAKLNNENPLLMFDTIVEGTKRTLEFANFCGAKKFLFVSSGAVYGKQPSNVSHISEDYNGAPNPMEAQSAYGEGKRAAEMLCTLYSKQYHIEVKIARCFAFVGPYLPLDAHFAIGNFIRDASQGDVIRVNGDGTPCRSYLYASDLVVWLWTILLKGKSNYPYNVGSDEVITIAELAKKISDIFDSKPKVMIAQPISEGKTIERYIPSIKVVSSELKLKITVCLEEAIQMTFGYYRYK